MPAAAPRPPHRKRYGWLRLYNDFPTHPKWALVATMTCVDKSRVVAIVAYVLTIANKGKPRGSIADFDMLECAAGLAIPPDEVRRVYKTLEDRDWIQQGFISTWDDRQPDAEDPTAAERQKRARQRKKERRRMELDASRRDSCDVTTRPDTDKLSGASVTGIAPGTIIDAAEYDALLKEQHQQQRALPFGPVVVKGSGRR